MRLDSQQGVKVSFFRKEGEFLTDSYSDDPVDYEAGNGESIKSKFSGLLAFVLLLVGGTYFVQTTLAANISLNTGAPVEFGQGITQTVACSGATNLTITPNATFTNASGGGAFYFSSVTVSNIPVGCYGKDFNIRAYGDSDSNPLAIFNSTSTDAVVWNNNGTFQTGAGVSGATVSSGTGTFTFTFTSAVALASSVFKITVESGAHTEFFEVGSAGPGGGWIFYYDSAGFDCGPDFNATGSPTGGKCNYLEVAPSGWNTGADPAKAWASFNWANEVPNVTKQNSGWNTAAGIGLGYKDSRAIVTYGNDSTSAAGAARAYSGGSKNDWYLPSPVESNLLCQWARGVASNITTTCTGGTLNSATYGASSAGLASDFYWTSTQGNGFPSYAATLHFGLVSPTQNTRQKNTLNKVRPIRAF